MLYRQLEFLIIMRRVLYVLALCAWIIPGCKKNHNPLKATSGSPAAFLSDKDYDKLQVEIQSVQGYEPSTQTVGNLLTFLQSHLRKPAGIEVVKTYINSPGRPTLTLEDVKAIEKSNRTLSNSGRTLTAYILFVDADYAYNSGNSQVLGMAYDFSSMVIFEKTVKNFSGGITQPSVTTLETTVTDHEFGHIMGLVNNGSRMVANHQDAAHGAHCRNSSCLMYWSAETSDIIGNILGNNIPSLDQDCVNDLRYNGGM